MSRTHRLFGVGLVVGASAGVWSCRSSTDGFGVGYVHRRARQCGVSAGGADGSDVAAIQAYIIDRFYADSDIRHSFIGLGGDQIDCIDFTAQHSVQVFQKKGIQLDPTSIPPPPPLAAGVSPPNILDDLPFKGQPDVNGSVRSCPSGTVAAKRPSVATIQQMGGLTTYINATTKARPLCSNSSCSEVQSCYENDCFLQGTSLVSTFEHAVGIQKIFNQPLYGMYTFTPVYNPTVAQNNGEHSVDQLWVQTGTCENWSNNTGKNQCNTGNGVQSQAVQSVEAGWLTTWDQYPSIVAFITPDGYFTNCYAGYGASCCNAQGQESDCWVAATNPQYVVNETLGVSSLGSTPPQDEVSFQVWNGSANNPAYPGWWVWINGSLLGWYPPDSFEWPTGENGAGTYGPMAFGPATYMQVGGEVLDNWPNQEHTETQMGTGIAPATNFVSNQYGWTAYHRNVSSLNANGLPTQAQLVFWLPPSCEGDFGVPGLCGADSGWWINENGTWHGAYSLSFVGAPNNSWGQYFFFGGGESNCAFGANSPCTPP